MSRARSRLRNKTTTSQVKTTEPAKPAAKPKPNRLQFKTLILSYLHHLPTLLMGLVFAGLTFLIITRVSPQSIKHFLLPNSYLPFLLSLFLAVFFLLSFIFLNSRRGFFLALLTTTLVFLQLQQVIFTWLVLLLVVGPILLIELIATLINSHA